MADIAEEERTVFVTNLLKSVSDELLYELFMQAGPIDQCSIADKTRDMRVGVVIFKHQSSVNYAKDIFEGTKLFDQELIISSTNILAYPLQYSQSTLRGGRPYVDHGYRDEYEQPDSRQHRPERGYHDRRDRVRPEPYNAHHRRRNDNHNHQGRHDYQRHHHHHRHF